MRERANQPEPRQPVAFDEALRRLLQSPPQHKKAKPRRKAKLGKKSATSAE